LDAGLAVSSACAGTARPRSRIFLLMATCGLDADVVYRVEQARRGHISHLSYIKPIVAAFRNYGYPPLRIHLRQKTEIGSPDREGRPQAPPVDEPLVGEPLVARWMFLFNLPCYARGLPFTPRACGQDGWL